MDSPTPIRGERFRLYSVEELLSAPPPEWLIDGLFETESQVVLYGAPGSAKSFIALDWALSIASGRPWLGRRVRQGPVIYIAAEGGKGITKRVQAWQQQHEIESVPGARLVVERVQLFHPPPTLVGLHGREIRGRDEIEDLTLVATGGMARVVADLER